MSGVRRRLPIGIGAIVLAAASVSCSGTDPGELRRTVQEDLQAGRLDEAERGVERLFKFGTPTDADLMLRAQISIARERADEAIEWLAAIPESSPLYALSKLMAGQTELRRGRFRAAEDLLLRAVEVDPEQRQAHRELIYIYGFRRQTEAIEQQFLALAETGPITLEEAFVWSLIRGVQWSPEEIVETLGKAVELDPSDEQSRIALADSLTELTRFDEAAAVLAPLDPQDPDAIAARGRLALECGELGQIMGLLADARATDDHAELAMLRGKAALQLRDTEGAIDAYRSALELRPYDRDALSGLSQALNQAGRRDEAAEVIERLSRVNALNNLLNERPPLDSRSGPEWSIRVGRACEAIGFYPQARAWYQIALSFDPFSKEAQEALARLGVSEDRGAGDREAGG